MLTLHQLSAFGINFNKVDIDNFRHCEGECSTWEEYLDLRVLQVHEALRDLRVRKEFAPHALQEPQVLKVKQVQ